MSKKTSKNAESETPVAAPINPDHLIVNHAFDTLSAEAKEAVQNLFHAGEGAHYKALPTDPEGGFGKAKLHQLYLGSGRKSTKTEFQPDHRTVAAAARRGFLVRAEGEKIFLNAGLQGFVREALEATFAS